MRLANRLTFGLLAAMALILVIQAAVRIQRETAVFRADMERDHATIGRALGHALAEAWDEGGRERAVALLQRLDTREPAITLRWVDITETAAAEFHPSVDASEIAALALGTRVVVVGTGEDGQAAMYTYVPLTAPGAVGGAIEIAEPLTEERAYVRATVFRVGTSLLALLTVFAVVIPMIGRVWVGRPVDALIAQVRRVGQGDLSQRIAEGRRDELGTLAVEVNRMTDQLAAAEERASTEASLRVAVEAQLRHADRLRLVGLLAAGVVHDIGTPLNVVRLQAQLLLGAPSPGADEIEEASNSIVEQCDRIAELARRLLDFSRPGGGEAVADVQGVARRTLTLVAAPARKGHVRLELAGDEARAAIPEAALQQVLVNLVVNAIHAMPDGGTVRVSVASHAPEVVVTVEDEGTGIPAAHLPRLFDPFFSTKPTDQGTGLGLAVCRALVEGSGGRIAVESAEGEGTRFTLHLPDVGPAVA